MLYLSLSVLCSVLLGFIFKLYPKFGVDGFQAIIFNYFTCFACGWLQMGKIPFAADGLSAPWVPFALVLGFVFISGFNGVALTVRYFGVTVSQIMQKMSILITVPFAILAFQESSGVWKIVGIVLALAAIILVNWPSKATGSVGDNTRPYGKKLLLIPAITWLLAGILEVLIVTVQKRHLIDPDSPTFISTVFGTAGAVGLAIAIIGWIRGTLVFSWRNVAGGIILGIPNYGSMLFMIMALGKGLEGSLAFPAANVGVIIFTTIGAVSLFQERLSGINWAGIVLAVVSIALISG
jgi:drug/metabolite transporter (DMT)-like permease